MSHFIGLVFLRPDADLDNVLAPFNEQDEEYMKFVDKTDEVVAEYSKLPDSVPSSGTYIHEIDCTDIVNKIWDEAPDEIDDEEDRVWKPYTKKGFPTPTDIAKNKKYDIIPDETKRNGMRFVQKMEREWANEPSREKYPTIDDFACEYYGYEKTYEGKYGYYDNPNAKWDWYQEGGRWDGYLTNKEGNKTDNDYLTEIDWDKVDVPFCFIDTDGGWNEKGQMGFWAMVSNEKKKSDWETEFKEYVKRLSNEDDADEIEVVAVDFHI